MMLPRPQDAVHKAWLYRVLTALLDEPGLIDMLHFKGGTCVAMLGWLDRFSVDLDFDFVGGKEQMASARHHMERVFARLGLEVKDESSEVPQYFLRYPAQPHTRNTMKIDATFPPSRANIYKAFRLADIDRIATCQTKETMFANKMVALIERHERHEAIAGRDLYDVHHFFMQGFSYNEALIEERRGRSVVYFLQELKGFIDSRITQKVIDQDLNTLLPYEQFSRIRRVLKEETLRLLQDECERVARLSVSDES